MLFLRLCLVITRLFNFQLGSRTAVTKSLFDWFSNWLTDSFYAVSNGAANNTPSAIRAWKESDNADISKQASKESTNADTLIEAPTDLLASNRAIPNANDPYVPMLPSNIVPGIDYWEGMRIVRNNLGEGKNGLTKVVQFPNRETAHYALKTISKARIGKLRNGRDNAISEIATHRATNHQNVVKLMVAYEDQENIYIVTELCEGGDLFEAIQDSPGQRFDESKSKQIAWGIAQGIKHLHDLLIVHRDLKTENIFLTPEGVPKIGDFEFAKKLIFKNERIHFLEGTEAYVAPEIRTRSGHSFPADIWSFGVIIYCMVDGFFPFDTETLGGINNAMLGIFKFWQTDSELAKDLIKHMLVVNVGKRYTIDQVIAHPWFDDIRDQGVPSPEQDQQSKKTSVDPIDLNKEEDNFQSSPSI